ncbi:hypothetical protein E3U43_011313 [Larimichthys crocea]|uniref:Uncharacterized protein n=1 Tax=Larimichthys crocea TaxID=215358 RepID=A0ACD3QJD8_LARCR|nr:hypothetical protein E3U43_011313 [Larimichthys crocea]
MGRGSKTSRGTSHSFRYRTISSTSDVDETLFGSPTQVSSHLDKCGKSKAKNSRKKPRRTKMERQFKSSPKTSFAPSGSPKSLLQEIPSLYPSTELERITSNSQILTKEEREAQKATREKKKEEEHKKAEEMKRRMMELDMSRKQNPLSEEGGRGPGNPESLGGEGQPVTAGGRRGDQNVQPADSKCQVSSHM